MLQSFPFTLRSKIRQWSRSNESSMTRPGREVPICTFSSICLGWDKVCLDESPSCHTNWLGYVNSLACDHPSLVYEDYNTDREAIGLGGIEWKQSTTDASLTATHECQICETAYDFNTNWVVNAHWSLVDRLPAGSTAFYCEYCADITDQTSTRTRSASLPDSAKIRMISRILRIVDKRGGNEKTVIFSQFTSMLNLIEPFLQTQRRKYVRCEYYFYSPDEDAN